MGLLAHIHQTGSEVNIQLEGRLQEPERLQLRAILAHFAGRGCRSFILDLSRLSPLTTTDQISLRHLTGEAGYAHFRVNQSRAIRLLADSPAVHQ
jgi:hypothetical protein